MITANLLPNRPAARDSIGNMAALLLSGILPGKIGEKATTLLLTCGYFLGYLISALTGKQYGKIYICLGLNELGWAYPEVFEEDYRTLITQIRSIQPTALIYLLAIVPVNETQFDNDYIYNTRIQQYNSMILSVAESNRIYYVDCYAGMADASGALNPSYTSDGFYINEAGAEAWWNYIASHTVDPEVYEN